jgi:hypothetical protein
MPTAPTDLLTSEPVTFLETGHSKKFRCLFGGPDVLNRQHSRLLLVFLLRLGAAITGSAFLAVFLPTEWMARIHEWLGLGDFPRVPIVDYLARSLAAFYGFHGVLLLIVSFDLDRYRAIIWFLAFMNVTFGLMLTGVDSHAGMPAYWTFSEGPPLVLIGVAFGFLNWRSR